MMEHIQLCERVNWDGTYVMWSGKWFPLQKRNTECLCFYMKYFVPDSYLDHAVKKKNKNNVNKYWKRKCLSCSWSFLAFSVSSSHVEPRKWMNLHVCAELYYSMSVNQVSFHPGVQKSLQRVFLLWSGTLVYKVMNLDPSASLTAPLLAMSPRWLQQTPAGSVSLRAAAWWKQRPVEEDW